MKCCPVVLLETRVLQKDRIRSLKARWDSAISTKWWCVNLIMASSRSRSNVYSLCSSLLWQLHSPPCRGAVSWKDIVHPCIWTSCLARKSRMEARRTFTFSGNISPCMCKIRQLRFSGYNSKSHAHWIFKSVTHYYWKQRRCWHLGKSHSDCGISQHSCTAELLGFSKVCEVKASGYCYAWA